MSKLKRIIPCLDVTAGRVVKGVNFVDLQDIGDPIAIAQAYEAAGADELVFLDITATVEGRKTMIDLAQKTAQAIQIPLTVGGGVHSMTAIEELLAAGVAKVSLGSAALTHPSFIQTAAETFGSEKIVLAIDAKKIASTNRWSVYRQGGRVDTKIDAIEWAQKVEQLGAGEILLTSMDGDGTKAGYDLPLTKAVSDAVSIPVIASGGCGKLEDIVEVFRQTSVQGALAASVFHYGEISIAEIQARLKTEGIVA
ncbi:imidazole glycerol phosphate synthase subunit HisF [Enterococcus sp. LJL98]